MQFLSSLMRRIPAAGPRAASLGAGLAAALTLAGIAGAASLGDDGLHKAPWMQDTFKDLREDAAEAAAAGQSLLLLVEQRGCIYCRKMHKEVFADPEIARLLEEEFFVIQLNMFGDIEVTDFDGTSLPEKEAARRWGLLFTPTVMLFERDAASAPVDATAPEVALASMPGAFGRATTRHLLEWARLAPEARPASFQQYHAERLSAEQ